MIASLVDAANLHRYIQIEWDKTTTSLKGVVAKAEKAKDKAEKENKAFKSQCAILENEKVALTKAMGEAKTAKDEAVAMADSLRSEQDRLVRVAKKAEEKIVAAISERDNAVRALEEERVLLAVKEKAIREEAGLQIIKYGMTFRRSTIFMVKEKYPDLNFSDINFSDMKGHDSADPPVSDNAALVQ